MKVFLHYKNPNESQWTNVDVDYATIPRVGEHLMPYYQSPIYKVTFVVHTCFRKEGTQDPFDAEVYAVAIENNSWFDIADGKTE